jgi:DNA-directed RNA polymerase specialized sigma24 family protein
MVAALLNCHGERLYRLLVRLTLREDVAEDLLQDLAVKLSQASGFAAAENPYAYARRAAVNLAFSWITHLRGRDW